MLLSVAAALLVMATPSAGAADGEQPAKPAKEKKICKNAEAESYSRLPKKVCKTAQQWEEARGAGDRQKRNGS